MESLSRLLLKKRRIEAGRGASLWERNSKMDKKRILVADDYTLTRKIIAKMLQDEGYDVVLAADGQEAIALLSLYCPDLVLTDLSMPRLNGIGVLTCAKRISPATPVIIFTADVSSASEQEARRLGVRDYVQKPFDIDDLLKRITSALNS